MIEKDDPGELTSKLEEIQQKKRQVWLILVIMLISFCLGTLILFTILWLIFK